MDKVIVREERLPIGPSKEPQTVGEFSATQGGYLLKKEGAKFTTEVGLWRHISVVPQWDERRDGNVRIRMGVLRVSWWQAKQPNKPPEPTPGSVTLRASSQLTKPKPRIAEPTSARSAPAPGVAHLWRWARKPTHDCSNARHETRFSHMSAGIGEVVLMVVVVNVAALVVLVPLSFVGAALALDGLAKLDSWLRRRDERRRFGAVLDDVA
jgi:hypothetical protein